MSKADPTAAPTAIPQPLPGVSTAAGKLLQPPGAAASCPSSACLHSLERAGRLLAP